MKLTAIPIPIKYANEVVDKHHRHNGRVTGALFAIGALSGNVLQAVVIVGRPIARALDNGYTAEVLRLCALPDAQKGVNSFLYGASWRAWKAMGGRKMITYTLKTESGASLRGAGWKQYDASRPQQWNGTRKREELDIYEVEKYRWEIESGEGIPAVHPKNYRLYGLETNQLELERLLFD
jgi:hypothetical protein